MSKLKQLKELCKCSVTVNINAHKDFYQSVQQCLDGVPRWYDDIDTNVMDKMIELDTIVTVQVYPDTPIRFNLYHHYDIDTCIDLAIADLKD